MADSDEEREAEAMPETDALLAFIESQAGHLKTMEPEELSGLKLNRAAAALADITGESPPHHLGAVFLTAWKRTARCHHFWGPTVGDERFCTKCQVPHSAVGTDQENPGPRRHR